MYGEERFSRIDIQFAEPYSVLGVRTVALVLDRGERRIDWFIPLRGH
jgi:hypothetical protein